MTTVDWRLPKNEHPHWHRHHLPFAGWPVAQNPYPQARSSAWPSSCPTSTSGINAGLPKMRLRISLCNSRTCDGSVVFFQCVHGLPLKKVKSPDLLSSKPSVLALSGDVFRACSAWVLAGVPMLNPTATASKLIYLEQNWPVIPAFYHEFALFVLALASLV